MILQRWDYKTREYKPFKSPAKVVMLTCNDMDREIYCHSCGKAVLYGKTYTSREIHTNAGLGFPVCEKCYYEEFERDSQDREVTRRLQDLKEEVSQ